MGDGRGRRALVGGHRRRADAGRAPGRSILVVGSRRHGHPGTVVRIGPGAGRPVLGSAGGCGRARTGPTAVVAGSCAVRVRSAHEGTGGHRPARLRAGADLAAPLVARSDRPPVGVHLPPRTVGADLPWLAPAAVFLAWQGALLVATGSLPAAEAGGSNVVAPFLDLVPAVWGWLSAERTVRGALAARAAGLRRVDPGRGDARRPPSSGSGWWRASPCSSCWR